MKTIIENGGLDLSLYRNDMKLVKIELLFFNQILDTIHLADSKEELLEKMNLRFAKRTLRNLRGTKRYFSFDFTDEGMEVWQEDNPNRIMFVECC